MTDQVAAQLLDALRERLDEPALAYTEEPIRLPGGYYTDNRAFRLASNDQRWSIPLVLRLFPREGPVDQVRREAVTQNVLAAQRFPVASVLWFEEDLDIVGRRFLIMERLDGRAPLGGAEFGAILRSLPFIFIRLPRVTSRVQAQLHALEAAPLVTALEPMPAGLERWFEIFDERLARGMPELGPGVDWLREHQPEMTRRVICHGDLWPGNLLVRRGRVVGVLDWTVATVADPALDVGFTSMSLSLAPTDAGPAITSAVTAAGRWMARRFTRNYQRRTGADLRNQAYFEAMRVVIELIGVVEHRRAKAEGRNRDSPPPTWDTASDRMLDYFEARTGVRLTLPPRID